MCQMLTRVWCMGGARTVVVVRSDSLGSVQALSEWCVLGFEAFSGIEIMLPPIVISVLV